MIFSAECLSYIENWRDLINIFSKHTKFILISLYIPENPIGFVKSHDDLEGEISKYFDIIESVKLTISRFSIIFGKKYAV